MTCSCYAALEVPTKTKLINTVVSGMGKISKLLSTSSKCTIEQESLEAMSILAYAIVSLAEKDAPTGTTSKKGKNMAVDWNHNKIVLMESIKSICASPTLPRLYQTYADLENLVGYEHFPIWLPIFF